MNHISIPFVGIGKCFNFQVNFDLVTLVLLSSVFASTVNAILIGFVLSVHLQLMLLLIKCKTTNTGLCWVSLLEIITGQTAQNKLWVWVFKLCSLHIVITSIQALTVQSGALTKHPLEGSSALYLSLEMKCPSLSPSPHLLHSLTVKVFYWYVHML